MGLPGESHWQHEAMPATGCEEAQALTASAPAQADAGCYMWPVTRMWMKSACLNPWSDPSSAWYVGFGTRLSPGEFRKSDSNHTIK